MPTRDLPENIQPGDPEHIVHHDVLHDLLNPIITGWLVTGGAQGLESARPESPAIDADNTGFQYWSTDIGRMDRWNGTTWDEGIGGGVGGSNFRQLVGSFPASAVDGQRSGDDVIEIPGALTDFTFKIPDPWLVDVTIDAFLNDGGSIFPSPLTIVAGDTSVVGTPDVDDVEADDWLNYEWVAAGASSSAGGYRAASLTSFSSGSGVTLYPAGFTLPLSPNYETGDLLNLEVIMAGGAAAPTLVLPSGWLENVDYRKTANNGSQWLHHWSLYKFAEGSAAGGTGPDAGTISTVPGGDGDVDRPTIAIGWACAGMYETDPFDDPDNDNFRVINSGLTTVAGASATLSTVPTAGTEETSATSQDVAVSVFARRWNGPSSAANDQPADFDNPPPTGQTFDGPLTVEESLQLHTTRGTTNPNIALSVYVHGTVDAGTDLYNEATVTNGPAGVDDGYVPTQFIGVALALTIDAAAGPGVGVAGATIKGGVVGAS